MDIKLYNSLTKKEELFVPLVKGEVTMYVCGPTVYDDVHIGNLRPVIVFDTLSRFFQSQGYDVKYASNYTDVDDKIINRAQDEGVLEKDITTKYIDAFEKNVLLVGAKLPTYTPRATDYVNQMVEYINVLVDKGAAYVVDNEVFFSVESDPNYGVLSGTKINDLQAGSRVEENQKKRNPADFLLWKTTDVGIKWDSPHGKGRPGWHTECVVMINQIFKKPLIDIHGGGFDLKFPHHENEISQSQMHSHTNLANIWMHNGFINIDNEKMSKSIGNVIKAKDILKKVQGSVLRLAILSTHYRAPVSFSSSAIESSANEITKIERTLKQLYVKLLTSNALSNDYQKVDIEPFYLSLASDLNTPNAITHLYAVLTQANKALREKETNNVLLNNLFHTILEMLVVLGLQIDLPKIDKDDIILLQEYDLAKTNKDFVRSDELRVKLIKKNIL